MGIPLDFRDLVRETEEARERFRDLVQELREEGTCRIPEATRGS